MDKNSEMLDVLYVLPTKSFFLEGMCGRVSHAVGFSSGLSGSGMRVGVLSGFGIKKFFDESSDLKIFEVRSFFKLWLPVVFIKTFLLCGIFEKIVVRWRPVIPLFLFPFLIVKKSVWIEINSITGLDSRFLLVRKAARFSVWLSARFFGVIVVSDESKRLVELCCPKASRVCVVRNGFNPDFFKDYKPLFSNSKKCTLVYFGKKQSYYDWDMLYSVYKEIQGSGFEFQMKIYGFNESEKHDGISTYGPFKPENISGLLSEVENPILVLHASDSEVARAGSPMKLYEYAALGVPCILSSSLSEKIDSLGGFFEYTAGDSASLKETILSTANSYSVALKKAQASKDYALSSYSWPSVVRAWLESC